MEPACWILGETAFLQMPDDVEHQDILTENSETFYNELVELSKVVCNTLKSETSTVFDPQHTGPYFGNVQYAEGPTSGVTDGNLDLYVILETAKSVFPNVLSVFIGILVKNSEQLGLDPSSLTINETTNTVRFRFLTSGSTVELRVVPSEITTAP